MGMTSEDDKTLMFHNNIDSPLDDDANSRDTIGGNGPLKKGPWTSAEDAILIEYVTKNGGGNWNAVQKNSGLARCGKSCRLRWTNHLRPNLKKCAFSPEEEQLVIELHAKMGNKWARMADQLPGRTDNEIKNFWNTRIKRLQRAGLPIYPPGTFSQPFKEENQQSNDETTFSSQDAFHPDFIPFNEYQFQTIEFKGLKVDDEDLFPTSAFVDDPQGRFRGSELLFPPCLNGVNDDSLQNVQQPFVYSSPYDHNTICDDIASSMMIINGKPSSSSEPNWATEMELPSIQTQMDTTSWGPPSSPMRSFESVDVQIQNPSTENALSYNTSYLNSALFDPLLYESQTMNSSISRASNVRIDLRDDLSRDLYYTEFEAYGEEISPFGHSCSSVFSEGTPISRSSFDEPDYIERVCKVKNEATTMVPMQYGNKGNETINEMSFSRPDMLFPCDWFFSPDQF